ncbi:MAG: hypothetical protein BWY09_02413 [Candidatus Hydrogenedentes bacterium ADurb.Bin179]|nr:MAG: hypothetical protein BWY09_02413 [Candidatus Hydrogenedentes bacterium ADurb.Bin179]
MAHTEEIPQGYFHSGLFHAVIIDAQHQGTRIKRIIGSDRIPKVGYDAGPRFLHEYQRGTRFDRTCIAVTLKILMTAAVPVCLIHLPVDERT